MNTQSSYKSSHPKKSNFKGGRRGGRGRGGRGRGRNFNNRPHHQDLSDSDGNYGKRQRDESADRGEDPESKRFRGTKNVFTADFILSGGFDKKPQTPRPSEANPFPKEVSYLQNKLQNISPYVGNLDDNPEIKRAWETVVCIDLRGFQECYKMLQDVLQIYAFRDAITGLKKQMLLWIGDRIHGLEKVIKRAELWTTAFDDHLHPEHETAVNAAAWLVNTGKGTHLDQLTDADFADLQPRPKSPLEVNMNDATKAILDRRVIPNQNKHDSTEQFNKGERGGSSSTTV